LHIITSVDPVDGGPIEGLFQQAKISREAGIHIDIASLDSPDAACVRDCPVKVFALGMPGQPAWRKRTPWGHYGYQAGMVPWLRANIGNYDAVIVNGLWNYATMAARRVLVNGSVPYAVFTHGMLDPWFRATYPFKTLAKQLFWLVCEGPLLNNADAVFFTTKDEMVVSDQAFRPYHVRGRVVGFGTADVGGNADEQIAAFRAAVPELGDRRFLLYLSRIHPKKGVDLLIEAFGTIAHQQPDLDLVIAGPDQVGWREELAELAAELGIERRVHWPGLLSGDRKWGAFRGCEAFVLSSHQENFGVVVAEALACGKAVLISNKVQIWREISEHRAGLVKPDTLDGTRELLSEFTALPPDDVALIETNARALFETTFDIRQAIANINAAIADLVPQRKLLDA
jgi:glycosyltransferase involved in cell wall biosynthesis